MMSGREMGKVRWRDFYPEPSGAASLFLSAPSAAAVYPPPSPGAGNNEQRRRVTSPQPPPPPAAAPETLLREERRRGAWFYGPPFQVRAGRVEMAEGGRPLGFLLLGDSWNNSGALVTEGETQLPECALGLSPRATLTCGTLQLLIHPMHPLTTSEPALCGTSLRPQSD